MALSSAVNSAVSVSCLPRLWNLLSLESGTHLFLFWFDIQCFNSIALGFSQEPSIKQSLSDILGLVAFLHSQPIRLKNEWLNYFCISNVCKCCLISGSIYSHLELEDIIVLLLSWFQKMVCGEGEGNWMDFFPASTFHLWQTRLHKKVGLFFASWRLLLLDRYTAYSQTVISAGRWY